MYVAVLLVFDRISYRPGEGRMRPSIVSTKLISTKRRPLDVIENSLMLLAMPLPQAIKCLKKSLSRLLHHVESKDVYTSVCWDRGGIDVVHQTPNREVMSLIRTGDTVLCP